MPETDHAMHYTARVADYLTTAELEGITLDDVAADLNLPPAHLKQYLVNAGTNWRRILADERRRRLDEALQSHTSENIHDYTDLLGYSDQQTFCKMFQSWYGQTFRDWKNARRADNAR